MTLFSGVFQMGLFARSLFMASLVSGLSNTAVAAEIVRTPLVLIRMPSLS